MKKYKIKLKNGKKLTKEESRELLELMPIKDGTSTKNSNTLTSKITRSMEKLFTSQIATATFSNGYDNITARDYAYEWTNNDVKLRNNEEFGYYAEDRDCYGCWNDCTNFVSQAIYKGGMKQVALDPCYEWYYSDFKPSYSWGGAHSFYIHWEQRAGIAAYSSYLQVGDVVQAHYTGDSDIDTAIITRVDSSGNKWLTQHTTDKEEETTLGDWFSDGFTVYAYEMDKANN